MKSQTKPESRSYSWLHSDVVCHSIVAFVLFFGSLAQAQSPGDLDASFNPGTGADWRVFGIARQTDGKLVVGGQFNTFNGQRRNRITRLNEDGSTDFTFDAGNGADSSVNAVAIAPDGKILVGGDFYSFNGFLCHRLVRLNATGSVDTSFALAPGADGAVQAITVQADGKVLIAGSFTAVNGTARNRVARLNTDGSLDASFNIGSGANGAVLTITQQTDGKILIGGYFASVNGTTRNRVARLNNDGTLDPGFVPGTLDNGYVNSVSLTADGKVFIAGGISVGLQSRILRLLANGAVDNTFSPGNNAISSDVSTAIAQSDGKVLIGGYFESVTGVSRNGIARLNADGSLDPAFNPGVGANQLVWTLLLQPDGRLVAGGSFTTYAGVSRNRITRIHNDAAQVNRAPLMAAIGSRTVLEDSGVQNLNLSGIAPGPAGEAAQTVTNLTATSSNPAIIPHPGVTYTPGATTASLVFTPAANANGVVTISVVAQDNGGTAFGGVDKTTNTFTVTVTAVNDAPGFLLNLGATLVGWGRNDYGQTVAPPEAQGGIVAFDAGGTLTLVLKRNGQVLAWGDNAYGQADVPLAAQSGVTAISTHGHHNLALKADGAVVAWGLNDNGQTSVPAGATSEVTAVAAGLYHSVALKADGSVVAWGRNDYGQRSVPPVAASGVIAIAAGWDHTLALKANGSVVAWGSPAVANVPVEAQSGVIAVASGMFHALALKTNGSVVAWGSNSDGQANVPASALSGVIAIAGGGYHSLALKDTGAVVAWGRNTHGARTVPPTAASGVVAIAAGGDHSLALVGANNLTVAEDAGAQTIPVGIVNISPGPANETSQVVNFIVANSNPALFSSPPAFDTAGTLTYTPALNANGSATVTVYARDNGGTDNGGADSSAQQTFTITITPVNDAPGLTVIGVSGTEDTTLAFMAANLIGAYSDVEGTPLASITVVTLPTSGTLKLSGVGVTSGQVIPVADLGNLTYVPAAHENGAKTFTVTASDGSLSSAPATVTMTLAPVNDAPSFTLPLSSPAEGPYIVSTLAGTAGSSGSTDSIGAVARFNTPTGAALDREGNVFVPDLSNHTIRKITPSGLVTTIAGQSGQPGSTDGTGAAARFNFPSGVAVGVAGDIYVSDNGNRTIRKISPDGMVTTLAGLAGSAGSADGVGAAARFGFPFGVAVDAAGNVYVADVSNYTIRKITPDGVVTTLAGLAGSAGDSDGTGSEARFNYAYFVAVDGAGNVYATDANNHTVRKISPGGMVTTLAGRAGLSGSADGTGSEARFFEPAGVVVDITGQVFIGDGRNYTIRKITPAGAVTTVAGLAGVPGSSDGSGEAARFSGTYGMAVDAAGLLYVSDPANYTVRKLTPTVPASLALIVAEDTNAQTVGMFASNILVGPPDEQLVQTVSFTVTNDNNALFLVQPFIDNSSSGTPGALHFTPKANSNGTAIVTVIAVDSGGAPGVSNSMPQTFTITVTPVNDAPSFSLSSTNVTVFPGDGGVVVRPNWVTNLSAGAANEAGQTVTLERTNSNPAMFVDQPVLLPNGTLEFTPRSDASGVVTVGVRAMDNGGTETGGVNTSGWQTFTITFAAVKVFVSESPVVIAGSTVEVPISLAGIGNEGGVSFTITYDRPRLVFQSAAVEPGSGLTLTRNEPYGGMMNNVGLIVTKPAGSNFIAGTNVMVRLTFEAPSGTAPTNTPISFSSAVIMQQVSDTNANAIPHVLYVPGSVTILAVPPLEGDVAPRTGGSGAVTVSDAVQLTRFVAGFDLITDFTANGEFQRADCAPRGTLGDGRVTLIDLVQTLRYAASLDPETPAGGPTLQAASLVASSPRLAAGSRVVRVAGGNLLAGRANTVSIQLDAQGNEAGVSLSLSFDPSAMTFGNAAVGSGAGGGSLVVNNEKAAAGRVGLVLVMPVGSGIAAGSKDIITLTFNVANVTGSTDISVSGDTPVRREVADVNANTLGATFLNGSFNLILPPGLKAAGLERAADGSLRLVVVNSDGSPVTAAQAARYEVHVTSDLGGAWTLLPNALVIENGALKIVDPAANGAGLRFYRLVESP